MRRTVYIILCLVVPVIAWAQRESADTLGMARRDTVPSYLLPVERVCDVDFPSTENPSGWMDFTPEYRRSLAGLANRCRICGVDVPVAGVADVASWSGGVVRASGSSLSMPGMMGVESGALSLRQNFGRLTFTGSVTATKYGYFRGLQTGYGFNGSLTYRISDRWSVTAFGSYSTGLSPMTPAMAGYMGAPSFGGYASYDINDHWGVSVGAQATKSLVTNQWEAQPIVEPYYRINKDVKIGVNVGGILYNVVKDYMDKRNHGGSPVMAPPRPGPPPVAPRR